MRKAHEQMNDELNRDAIAARLRQSGHAPELRGTALSVQPLAISDDYGAGDAAVGIWGDRSGGSAAFAIGATVEAQLAAASTRAAAQLRSLLPELPPDAAARCGLVEPPVLAAPAVVKPVVAKPVVAKPVVAKY